MKFITFVLKKEKKNELGNISLQGPCLVPAAGLCARGLHVLPSDTLDDSFHQHVTESSVLQIL